MRTFLANDLVVRPQRDVIRSFDMITELPHAPMAMPKQRLEQTRTGLASLWLVLTGHIFARRVGH